MSSYSRRTFLQTLGAATVAAAGTGALPSLARAETAQFKLKYANNLALSHPLNVRAKEAADAIKKETGGRVELQIFPNGQMGTDTDMLSQVRSGAIDFLTQGGVVLSTLAPVSAINGIGFAFKDYNQVWAAMDGELGSHIRKAISKVGLVAMEKPWDNGFRHLTSSVKPVQSPADLKGLKIRVPVSPLWTSMFKALDASPTSINFSEAYSALQTKVVDAEENPLALIETGRFYEVQKFCSLTGHIWDGFWFLANARSWDKLPPDLQAIVAKHLNAAAVAERADVAALSTSLIDKLQSHGMAFNKPDIQPFRASLQKAGFYDQWRKKYGDEAWALLEKYTQKFA
ncbi:TRAP dicarboxylate family transporter subunit DctP [Caballeronia arvi]|uniref:TRAP dicarboxylate family transporter subunit DctP n=1 Tax=Caballeronia arvi TaxID=1777135 RepID=A0A158J1S6_9BURK|nr:TRAP transporter substrate-binding protein [Caballeronia arvi]SAL62798.1 TRAP dicarboxylate family transporter subunit DctP [Caballeronia arvi]